MLILITLINHITQNNMEKTFEELIREYPTTALLSGRKVITDLESLYDLMQQVCEAKIAECEQYIEDNPEIALDFTRGREIKINLPTDRIKTEK